MEDKIEILLASGAMGEGGGETRNLKTFWILKKDWVRDGWRWVICLPVTWEGVEILGGFCSKSNKFGDELDLFLVIGKKAMATNNINQSVRTWAYTTVSIHICNWIVQV